jgi:hypothetical protein
MARRSHFNEKYQTMSGGRRKNSGRKKTLQSEVVKVLREKITDDDFEVALEILRYAMKQKVRNLKAATQAAQYILDQKMGKSPQSVDMTSNGEPIREVYWSFADRRNGHTQAEPASVN